MPNNNAFGNKTSILEFQFVILTTVVNRQNIEKPHTTYMAIIIEGGITCYNSSHTYVIIIFGIECEKCRFLIPDPEIHIW